MSDSVFYDKLGLALTFARGSDGRIAGLTMRWEGDPPARFDRRP